MVVEAYLHGRSHIKVANACIGKDEVISGGYIVTMCMAEETKVKLKEVCTYAVLVGKFTAVTGAYTNCTGLCRSDCRECKHAKEDNK